MTSIVRTVPAFLFALACLCGPSALAENAPAADGLAKGLQAIKPDDIRSVIETLSSDDFEGREPGSHGETLTVDYITRQFKKIGLAPGNPDGSYIQNVPLTGHISHPEAQVAGGSMSAPDDFVAWSYNRDKEVVVKDSDLVFVGYGVVAPDYGWDDFKGADLKGKTLVMLINDPPIPDPADPSKLDDKMFKGKAMTYYGRWTYKYEIARKMGAAAALIIHETEPAAYPYSVVVNSYSHENFEIHAEGPNEHFPTVAGWLAEGKARSLLQAAGYDLDSLKKQALSKDFHPVPLKTSVSFSLKKSWRDVESRNVVGKIEGSDPKLKSEVLVISAHWDHLGWDPTLPGTKHDQVFHGARDNASGIASLMALAKAFKALPTPPKRSVLFIATTAEEKGLLGAQYYATHPLYPLKKTVADINIDEINTIGKTKDVEIVGNGNTTLEDELEAAAASVGRTTRPDSHSEKGYFFRADQLEFARVGVPVLYVTMGEQALTDQLGYSAKVDAYTANQYHRPADQITPDWDFDAAVEDIGLLFRVGYEVAEGQATPQWKDGSEFKAVYEKMMKAK
jgi:Zn-dependent M28 family amino/carboxypeptidase